MHRTEGANHSSNMFTDGPPGTTLEENWANAVQEEISAVIEGAGLSLLTAATDTRDQLYTAISQILSVKNNWYTDSGAANAYVLTKVGTGAPVALTDGMVVEFMASANCTGASTVNVEGLGVKSIKLYDGSNIPAGSIKGNGIVKIVYDLSNDWFELMIGFATQTSTGQVRMATNAEAQGQSATDRAITPSNLAALEATESIIGLIEKATSAEVIGLGGAGGAGNAVTVSGLAAIATAAATASRLALRDASARINIGAADIDTQAVRLGQFTYSTVNQLLAIPFWNPGFGVVDYFYFQFKEVAIPNNSSVAFTWNFAFPTTCLGALITRSSALDDYSEEAGVSYTGLSTSGMTIHSSMATNAMVFGWGY